MTTVLDTHGPPAPTTPAFWIRPTRDVARQLGRYLSPIAAKVRTAFGIRNDAEDADKPREIIIDLSRAVEVPQAQLILLVTLLRSIVGPDTPITLSGVRPMNLGSLVTYDLPGDVTVVDTRGRTWTNRVVDLDGPRGTGQRLA